MSEDFSVLNNPLSLSDPSGFYWWNSSAFRSAIKAHTQFAQWHGFFGEAYVNRTYGYALAQNPYARLAGSLVAAFFTYGAASAWAAGLGASQAVAGATGAVASGFAAGGITGGNIQSALTGAFTSLATFGLLQGIDGLAGAAGGAGGGGEAAVGASTVDGGGGYVHSPVSDMSVGMGTSDACVACTYRATYQELGITADTPISRVGLVEIVGRNSAYERIAGGYERFLDWRNANPWFSQAVEIGVVLGMMRGGGMKSGQMNPAQMNNVDRFVKKLPTNAKDSLTTRPLPGDGVAAQGNSPGKVPGSSATYEKQIDAAGNTVQYTKTTYDPAGNIIHVKDKLTGGVFP